MIQTALLEQSVQEEIFEDVASSDVETSEAVEHAAVEQETVEDDAFERQTCDEQPALDSEAAAESPAEDSSALDVNWEELTSAQNIALVALTGGRTKAEAARMAGVHRNTLYRWLDETPLGEAVERARGELREAAQARLHSLADEAAGCIQMAMRGGDARTALQLIKLLGTLDESKPSPGVRGRATHDDRFAPPWESASSTPPDDSDDPKAQAERHRMERLVQFERNRQMLLRGAALCVGLLTGIVYWLGFCLERISKLGSYRRQTVVFPRSGDRSYNGFHVLKYALVGGGWLVRHGAGAVRFGWLTVSKSLGAMRCCVVNCLAKIAMIGNWRPGLGVFVRCSTTENLTLERSVFVQEEVRSALSRRQWHPIVDSTRRAMGRFSGFFVPCFALLRRARTFVLGAFCSPRLALAG